MRAINKKIIFLYLLVIAYLGIRILSINNSALVISNEMNVGIWGALFLLGIFFTKGDYNRYLEPYDKVQTTFIIVIAYLMFNFLLGLFVGYQYNAYSMTPRGLLHNTIMFMPIIIFQEYIRQVLVSYSNGKTKWLAFITILFILISVNFNSLSSDFRNAETGFKFLCSDLIPLVARNFVFTYLAYISSCKPPIVYRLLTTAASIYLPILPNINWFYTGLFGILVPIALYIVVNYSQAKLERKLSWRDEKKSRPITYVPTLIIVLLVVGFVVGFFKYQPAAIISDSMLPLFARGDMIVIEKLDKEDIENIKVGDVIKFLTENYYVIHRVHEIEQTDDGPLFTTKGDNNNAPDSKKVKPDQIQGIYRFHVKYIGFPSVWLSEVLR
ncbi:MAG: signal peptidase I [Bacilli bacterium]|nr:signal peptidase I [Bacilli bacterium]